MAAPQSVVESLRSGGAPIPQAIRAQLESTFQTELSGVRLHTDGTAARTAQELEANAFTVGSHIAFAPGRYRPGTPEGNRLLTHEVTHVVQQGAGAPTLQCDSKKTAKKQATSKRPANAPATTAAAAPQGVSGLDLPWDFGDFSLFEETQSGVQFLVAVTRERKDAIQGALPGIGMRIAADNARVKDPAMKVNTCIIAGTTTRYAHLNGVPVLMLDPDDANGATAAHEMGHGLFYALEQLGASPEKGAASGSAFRLKIADIYARLSRTKPVTIDDKSVPAGVWPVDPSQWSPGSPHEHPWDGPDEFFASAEAAFQTNRKGLETAIAKFTKIDPAVAAPAKELLELLASFLGKGKLPAKHGLSAERKGAAETELARDVGVSKVEDTIMPGTPLDWLLHPANRPKKTKPKPSLQPD
jgi:hypothetical protein